METVPKYTQNRKWQRAPGEGLPTNDPPQPRHPHRGNGAPDRLSREDLHRRRERSGECPADPSAMAWTGANRH